MMTRQAWTFHMKSPSDTKMQSCMITNPWCEISDTYDGFTADVDLSNTCAESNFSVLYTHTAPRSDQSVLSRHNAEPMMLRQHRSVISDRSSPDRCTDGSLISDQLTLSGKQKYFVVSSMKWMVSKPGNRLNKSLDISICNLTEYSSTCLRF